MNPVQANATLLLVDDDRDFAADLTAVLAPRYEVHQIFDGDAAEGAVRELRPDVVMLDLDFGPGRTLQGLEILERIRSGGDPPPVLMLTGNEDRTTVVEAIQLGAFHYLGKPPNPEEMLNLLQRAVEYGAMRRRIRIARKQADGVSEMVAEDPVMRKIITDVDQVAPSDTTVLITGESGTGKDVLAKRIHAMSQRADGPLRELNCAAISESLIDSELFGHEKGSYTGADSRRRGHIELADGGTLFLDEVGELPLPLQPKLLRVLEKQVFERVGGETTIKVDVRLIAATHRDLQEQVAARCFREDLYYRLDVFRIHLPPLRERRGDILPLARRFLAEFASAKKKDIRGFTSHGEQALLEHDWPGNVRELRNIVENAVVRGRRPVLGVGLLPFASQVADEEMPEYPEARSRQALKFKGFYVRAQLERAEGNVSLAARLSGVQRSAFQKMMRDCGVESADFRTD